MMRKRMHPVRGNILPLAMVITAAILLSGLGLGIIVLDSLRRTSDVDQSMVAYYAADAGVEKQLYELRKNNARVADLGTLTLDYGNGSSWRALPSGFLATTAKIFPRVNRGDFQFVDLFDPDNIGAAGGVGRVDWSWTPDPASCGGGPNAVELGYAQWLTGGAVLPGEFKIDHGLSSPTTVILDPTKAYRLRLRPTDCDVLNLRVEVSPTATYAPMPFPGDITLGAEGKFQRATQNISVQIPRQDILSGVFSYVIFSECTLIKDPLSGAPACP
jgi:hypothetical protein